MNLVKPLGFGRLHLHGGYMGICYIILCNMYMKCVLIQFFN